MLKFEFFSFELLSLNIELVVRLFDLDERIYDCLLSCLQHRSLTSQLGTVDFYIFHALFQSFKALVVALLNLYHVFLTLVKESCKRPERPNEEYGSEVEDVFEFFDIFLCHVIRSQVHQAHSFENLWVKCLLSLNVVLMLAIGHIFIFFRSLLDLFVIAINKDLLSDLLKIAKRQILDPNHLRADHELLMFVHLFSEVVAARSEIEDEMEVLAHSL